MSLNGALAGLVAITRPCASVSPLSAVIIGAAAGIIVVLSVLFFDKIRVDDPVGAISVHGVCGTWGTLAVVIQDKFPC
jgi:Amt family ammonium transporter